MSDNRNDESLMDRLEDAGSKLLEQAKELGSNLKERAEDATESLRKRADKMLYRDESVQEGEIVAKQGLVERMEVAGEQLVDKAKDLLQESNTRRLIIRSQENKELLEIPLTGGIVAGGVLVFAAPIITALAALGGALARVKLEVIRDPEDTTEALTEEA